VLMGYLNPVERFGSARLASTAAAAGVDGLLLVDCPHEEMPVLQDELVRNGIHSIRLVAPTTTDQRLAAIASCARGFIYYVSFKGITGAGSLDTASLERPLAHIRAHSDLPVAVGFGIKDAASAAAVAQVADAVVIGSALVERLADAASEADACGTARSFVESVRQALDNEARSGAAGRNRKEAL